MSFDADGNYIPEHMTIESSLTLSLEGMLRKMKEDRLAASLPIFKKESQMLLDEFDRKQECPPVPGLDRIACSYTSLFHDWERQIMAWLCWQVAGTPKRGAISFNDQGEMVFHLKIERIDQSEKQELVTWDEVWIVLDPPKSLTSAYGG